MKKIWLLISLMLPLMLCAQDELLNELEESLSTDTTVRAAFKGLKVVNFESTKLAHKNSLVFIVSHRFGTVKNGFDDFFGLDEAVTQLKFIYGFTDWLNAGIARSSFQKTYGAHLKYRIFQQNTIGNPITVAGYNLITVNTELDKDAFSDLKFSDRLSYTSQLIVSHKASDRLTVMIAPTYLHENLATRSFVMLPDETLLEFDEENDQFAVGVGGRFKLTKRWSVNVDYGIHLNRNKNSVYNDPLSIGVDLETGGHVFQMHFTNAQPMFENGFISRGSGDWGEGDFYFGFNLSRTF